jgi:AraC-like DNA-binding protein
MQHDTRRDLGCLVYLCGGVYTSCVRGLDHRDASIHEDESHLWRADVLGGVELLRARYVEFTFPPHTHEEFMIAVTEGGTGFPRYRGGAHRVGPSDVLVLNPGEVHAGGPARGSLWRYRAFYPPAGLMHRAAHELTGRDRGIPQFTEDVVHDPRVAAALRRAHVALEEPHSQLERESRLLHALASLVERHAVDARPAQRIRPEHRAVRRAREYLETFPSENVSLDALAREAGLSLFHLCRVFRQQTGLSPHAYQTLLRVRLAKSLLAQGVAASQAAVDAGFVDQAHLTRHFKRIFGVTPGRYLGGEPGRARLPGTSP